MKKFSIGGIELSNRYIQAPLAGYTNRAMRKLAYLHGAALTYTEMISASAIYYNNVKTFDMIPTKKEDGLLALQLFDGEIDKILYAVKKVDEIGVYDFLDFNMGCPVLKVIKQRAGSYWLKREEELYELFKTLVNNSSRPVILKTRIGFDRNNVNILRVLDIAHSAGISAVAIHGRTRSEFYSGKVDYDIIKCAQEKNLMPIIASGDLCLENFNEIDKRINCSGYMFGRGAIGNPLIFKNLISLESGEPIEELSVSKQVELMKMHYSLLKEEFGERNAILQFRGISTFYLKGIPFASSIKSKLVSMNTETDFFEIIDKFIELNGHFFAE